MLAEGDDYADDRSTTGTAAVGQTVSGAIETSNDKDWFAIELGAGQVVSIYLSEASLPVPQLALYDMNGHLLETDHSLGEPASISIIIPESGTYYIEAGTLLSDTTGTYQLSVHEVAADLADPIVNTITWGTQLNSNTIRVYFAPAGTIVPGFPFPPRLRNIEAEEWNDYEKAQFQKAFDAIEAVIDVNFVIVPSALQADLTVVIDTNEVSGSFLGVFNPPGTTDAGLGIFDGTQWDRSPGGDLELGGFGYVTIMHELLHGLGLAHPHDTGDGSSTVMPGVTSPQGDYGDHGLNQGIYTTMSYNSGFPGGGPGQTPTGEVGVGFGFEAGPMAIDIAALQAIYGANTTHAAGNTIYTLPTGNTAGTYWQSIWDTGGTDEIRHPGTTGTGAVIDLRPATLEYAPGGGGFISAVNATAGGFTIAHGVVIENATGGSGGDRLQGNDVANRLNGNGGFDTIFAGLGDDRLNGGAGNDKLHGEPGNDLANGGGGADTLFGEEGSDTLNGGDLADRLFGGPQNDTLNGQAGFDRLDGGAGNDLLDGGHQADNLYGGAGNDTLRGGQGLDRLFGGAGEDFGRGGDGNDGLFGQQGHDTLNGEAGNDRFFGGMGNDVLNGASGQDTLFGGAGYDTLYGGAGNDRLQGDFNADTFVFDDGEGQDTITDFDATNPFEKIDLSAVSTITNMADLSANHMSQAGGNVVIDTGGGHSITLQDVRLADLDVTDFLF